jgi:hypothetical protein
MSANWFGGEVDTEVIRRWHDTQLDQRITDACTRLSLCTSRDEAWPHWCEFCRLIESRSAEAVARLERTRGLRK